MKKGQAVGLMYHDVVDQDNTSASGFIGEAEDSYKLDTVDFEQHLVELAAVADAVTVGNASPPLDNATNSVMLTFDDGGESAATHIASRLEGYGWRGIFFITTDRIDTKGFVSKDQLRQMHQNGHVIGSHSHTHPRLMSSLSEEAILNEWQTSVDILQDILGISVNVASVPHGFYSRKVGILAAQTGIEYLFTTEPTTRVTQIEAGERSCQIIGRYAVRRTTPSDTVRALAAGSNGARFLQWINWSSKKRVKQVLGPLYLPIRKTLFTISRDDT